MKVKIPKKLTNKEQKALDTEINRQIAEHVEQMSMNLQAAVLWQVRQTYGSGKKKLLQFSQEFQDRLRDLQEFYRMENAEDTNFIYRHKLKEEVGIDVEELEAMFTFNPVLK